MLQRIGLGKKFRVCVPCAPLLDDMLEQQEDAIEAMQGSAVPDDVADMDAEEANDQEGSDQGVEEGGCPAGDEAGDHDATAENIVEKKEAEEGGCVEKKEAEEGGCQDTGATAENIVEKKEVEEGGSGKEDKGSGHGTGKEDKGSGKGKEDKGSGRGMDKGSSSGKDKEGKEGSGKAVAVTDEEEDRAMELRLLAQLCESLRSGARDLSAQSALPRGQASTDMMLAMAVPDLHVLSLSHDTNHVHSQPSGHRGWREARCLPWALELDTL